MIKINQLKLSINHTENELKSQIAKQLKIKVSDIIQYEIGKKSIDARKKNELSFVYSIFVNTKMDSDIIKKVKNPNVTQGEKPSYQYKPTGSIAMAKRPVIVGMGPAGLFCALMLARNGYSPILIDRGDEVYERVKKVETFWSSNQLDRNSNVQFGEGGAGTFSDGKLNTLVKDEHGRNKEVLDTFVKHGAPLEIQYLNKPHIGTDKLRDVVKGIREEIIMLGGEVRFNTCLTNVVVKNNKLVAIELNQTENLDCETLVLAIGHSARDTFKRMQEIGLSIQAKPFAIGVRIEHPQSLIGNNQYGPKFEQLPAADYKLTHKASNGRGIYSFCMCPGGFVVNSSSEEGHLVVNGMSNYNRDEKNANSAMIVTVTPDDFKEFYEEHGELAGVYFQRKWERLAYNEGEGLVPVQLFKDLLNNKESDTIGSITPCIKGDYKLSNLRNCLPDYVIDTIIEGVKAFDRMIPGFANDDAILSGVETRTSSPIRMNRDENFESNIAGIYPCGEGAGYAGGITSAAIDGIKVYEAIANKYKHF